MGKITIYLIRHGRQCSPLCNVNVPLDDAGKRQAVLLGKRMINEDINVIYSSDLTRAKETAEIINKEINVPYYIYSEFREIDFGELTGLEDSVIKEKYKDFLKKRDRYEEDLPFPGGENGEQVFTRAKRALDEIIEECLKNNFSNVLIVTHGGTIRSLVAGILNMPQKHRLLIAKNLENTSITQLDYHMGSKRFYVEKINDYAHLESYDELLRKHFK